MEDTCKQIVEELTAENKTISFMESCTGGYLANAITNISGASDVLKVSLVTYSTEYKIKFGVDKNIINKYTVYSSETANEMAKCVAKFANSNIGVGVTGELGNTTNKTPKVYYSIYFADENKVVNNVCKVEGDTRLEMKKNMANIIFNNLLNLI